MLTDTQIAQFHQNGYLLGGKILDDQQVQVLRDEIDRAIRERDREDVRQPVLLHNMTGKADAAVWQIVNIWEASEPFLALSRNAEIVGDVARLTGTRRLRIWHDQIQFKPAGTGGQNDWHQDIPYWPVLQTDNMITAWVALDDVDEDNGCMSMVPGSHKWGNQIAHLHTLKGQAFDDMPGEFDGHKVEIRRAPVKSGHVHFHHGLTWHGSHANRSTRPRRAIALHYLTAETYHAAGKTHIMGKYIESQDGEEVAGARFPIIWQSKAELQTT